MQTFKATVQASAPEVPGDGRRSLKLALAPLFLIAVLISVDRLSIYQKPLGIDCSVYAVMAHEVLSGRLLYTDLWDHKPPAIYITYAVAEVLVGYGIHTFYLLEVAAGVTTLFGIYFAASAIGGRVSGLWAAAFWAVLSGDLTLEATEPNAEVFMNSCLVWAFALLVRSSEKSFEWTRFLVIGVLYALASLYKPVAVVIPALVGLVYVATAAGGMRARLRRLAQVALIASAGIAVWVAVFGYFLALGRFDDFYSTFIYNSFYSGDLRANMLAPLRGTAEWFLNVLNWLVVTVGVGAVIGAFKNFRLWALLIAFCVATWMQIALPGHFWSHYYQLWLPPLIVGAGWTIGSLTTLTRRRVTWLPHAAGAALLLTLTIQQVPRYRVILSGDWHKVSSHESLAAKRVAQEVDALLAPDETLYVWGIEPSLYVWSRRRSPTGVFFVHHLTDGPVAGRLSAQVSDALARERPEVFIISKKFMGNKAVDHPILQNLYSNYAPLQIQSLNESPYAAFFRRGGSLEARMNSGAGNDATN